MDFIKWTEILKLNPRYIAPIIIFTGAFLFIPKIWLDTFSLTTLVNNYRQWVAITFFASCALVIPHFFLWIFNIFNNEISNLRFRMARIKYIKTLTPDEIDILRLYIFQQKRTQRLDITDGTVIGLEQIKIIYRISNRTTSLGPEFSYNNQPWAWNYLNTHREFLTIENSKRRK